MIAVPCIAYTLVALRHLQDEKASRVQRHVRIAMYLVIFLALSVFVFAYRFYAQVNATRWGDYFESAYARPALLGPVERPTGGSTRVPSRGLFFGVYFAYGIQGILIGLLFGTNKDILDFWRDRVRNLRHGRSFLSGISTSSREAHSPERSMRTTSSSSHMGATIGGTYT